MAREAATALGEAAGLALADARGADGASGSDLLWLWRAASELAHARPSMAAIATTVARICAAGRAPDAAAKALDAGEALRRVRTEAVQMASAWSGSTEAITGHAQAVLRGTVLTHSQSGTVEQALARLAGAGVVQAVVVTTSQPGGEGTALALALARRGIEVTLVADAAMGLAVADVDAVVLGADSVRADGSVVNKVGSLPLALCARQANVPVYVLCESLKVAPEGWPLTLEEMDPAELLPAEQAHLHARNVYFDRTPAELISTVITEVGPLSRERIVQLAETAAYELEALQAEWRAGDQSSA